MLIAEIEVRLDAVNVLNHPNFDAPLAANMSINLTSFGPSHNGWRKPAIYYQCPYEFPGYSQILRCRKGC